MSGSLSIAFLDLCQRERVALWQILAFNYISSKLNKLSQKSGFLIGKLKLFTVFHRPVRNIDKSRAAVLSERLT